MASIGSFSRSAFARALNLTSEELNAIGARMHREIEERLEAQTVEAITKSIMSAPSTSMPAPPSTSIAQEVRRVLFQELGIDHASVKSSVKMIVQNVVEAEVRVLVQSEDFRASVDRAVRDAINNSNQVNRVAALCIEEVNTAAQRAAAKAAEEFIQQNLRLRTDTQPPPSSTRKLAL